MAKLLDCGSPPAAFTHAVHDRIVRKERKRPHIAHRGLNIPKGFQTPAQGCDEGATLGQRKYNFYLEEVAANRFDPEPSVAPGFEF